LVIRLKIGPFNFSVKTEIQQTISSINLLYSDYCRLDNSEIIDFHLSIHHPSLARRLLKRQVNFYLDGFTPFFPLPISQSFAFFEWGMNWVIASHAHQYFMIHAAVISKNNQVAILPAPPGSGKSTLCAGLISRGWNLLSDEFALIEPETMKVIPIPRPVGLKNNSIEIIKKYADNPVFGSIAYDTSKGSVTHMKCKKEWLDKQHEEFTPRWVLFPKYTAGAEIKSTLKEKAYSFMGVAENSFNYSVLGSEGFETNKKLMDMTDSYDFEYSNLDSAVDFFNQLV
jgi:HprK-related kinase A